MLASRLALLAVLLIAAAVSAQPPVEYTGYWTDRTPMPTPRSDLVASVLGNEIILTGGCTAAQICPAEFCYCPEITNVVEAYVPDTDSYNTLASMPRARFRHGSEVVNGLLYVFGGRDVNDALIKEVDVYDRQRNQWTTLSANQSFDQATSDFSSFVWNNVIHLFGGYDQQYRTLGSSASFAPLQPNAVWEYGKLASMILPRGDTCATLIDDKLYLFGGFEQDNFCVALDTLEFYDFSENKWTLGPSMPVRGGDKACGLLHGDFHVFGGELKDSPTNCSKYSHPSNQMMQYSPSGHYWSSEPPMPKARFRFVAQYYKGQHEAIYSFGGQADLDTASNTYPVVNTVQVWSDFDFSAGTQLTSTSGGFFLLVLLIVLVF